MDNPRAMCMKCEYSALAAEAGKCDFASHTAHGLSCLWEKYFNCSQTQMESCDLDAAFAAAATAAVDVLHISLNH